MTGPAPSRCGSSDDQTRRPLGAAACRAVLETYSLSGVRGVRSFNRGNPASPKALVEADAGRFLLKRRAPGLDDFARVQTEHAAQIALQRAGLPVPAPLATRDGETIAVYEGRLYELYPYVEAEPFRPGDDSARTAGAVLARMHGVLERIRPPVHTPTTGRGRVDRAFDHLDSAAPELRHALDRLRHEWASALQKTQGLDLRSTCLTHGDYHPGNTLWRGRQLVAVIDFETMRLAPFIEETALAALYFSLDTAGDDPADWPDGPDAGRIESFWAGYGASDRFVPALVEAAPWIMIEGLIAEAVPRACRGGGFRQQSAGEILPFIARTAAWLSEHADGLGVVLLQTGH